MPDKRLTAAASLVRRGSAVCDVGADHGHLAVYLVESGIASRVTASDLNEGPLAAARRTIEAHGLSGKIRAVLSDGLRGIPPEDARDIVVCGMGGELIARIVLDCGYTRERDRRLILQPMTQAAWLRETLCANGFALKRELPVRDGRHHYAVMQWEYAGAPQACGRLFRAVGRIPEEPSAEAAAYLEAERARARRIAAGLERSGGRAAEAAEWRELERELAELLKERETLCQR